MKRTILTLALSLLLAGCGVKPYDNKNRYAVIISIDALRWDLPSKCNTPTLDSLRAVGTYCETYPVFPANTFPSHYSMATGLHPDHHGIVNNRFLMRDLGRTVLSWNPDDITLPGFWGGEPIWNTAERQGRTAHTYLWAGSQTPINGRQATRWIPYRFDASHRERMDWALESLRGEHGAVPNLTMVYVEQLDATMHRYGSDAPETRAELERIDKALGYFFREARKLPIFDSLNIIITSDHGTADTSPDSYVNFYGKLDSTRVASFIRGIPCSIEVDDDYVEEALEILNGLGHLTAYARDAMPERYHYGSNRNRIPNIVIIPETGWYADYSPVDSPYPDIGAHGFDNFDRNMHMVFYGAGPAFRKGYVQPSFQNQNVYIVLCHLLGIEPAEPNDCSWKDVRKMFRQ